MPPNSSSTAHLLFREKMSNIGYGDVLYNSTYPPTYLLIYLVHYIIYLLVPTHPYADHPYPPTHPPTTYPPYYLLIYLVVPTNLYSDRTYLQLYPSIHIFAVVYGSCYSCNIVMCDISSVNTSANLVWCSLINFTKTFISRISRYLIVWLVR